LPAQCDGGLPGGHVAVNEGAMEPSSDLEEIMRFDPDDGIADLDEHLDRLKRAADARGFRFDRHAARNELQAATFGKRRNATARLLLSPTGAMAIEVTSVD
jgi:para-aminobenzoate synthetase/4-amino-4-deoxychorismate lyase